MLRISGALIVLCSLGVCSGSTANAQDQDGKIQRVWFSVLDAKTLSVCCETSASVGVQVKVWREGSEAVHAKDDSGTLHHLSIPYADEGKPLQYELTVKGQEVVRGELRAPPADMYRIVVVGDWGNADKPDFTAIRKDQPHLLVTAGDNIPNLHQFNGLGDKEGTRAYSALIDSQPELFRSVPLMPVLGNHDREIRPRGAKAPPEPAYDPEAKAFRTFFALPEPEWMWSLDEPRFRVRLLGLDLHHTSDFGTTLQTGHAFGADSEQLKWFDTQTADPGARFVIAIQNERNSPMRKSPGWGPLFQRCTAVISGFGYFAERAEPAGSIPFFNTCLKGTGTVYKDPDSKFLESQHNYMLLSIPKKKGPLVIEIKSLDGKVLDRTEWPEKVSMQK